MPGGRGTAQPRSDGATFAVDREPVPRDDDVVDKVNKELRDFLRAARGRVRPSDAGLTPAPGAAARRVPGLRREEVAQLAGVSVDYYARLEQGRARAASASVLDAVAAVLSLNATERTYLHRLAGSMPASEASGGGRTRSSTSNGPTWAVRPGVLRLLEVLDDSPAFVLGRGTSILAMNDMARALLFDADRLPRGERNLARWTFLDPESRERYVDWTQVASDTAAMLRMDAAEAPEDPYIAATVGELSMKSPEFRTMWAEHQVFRCMSGRKRLLHPVAGPLELDYEALTVPGASGQALHVYTTPRGSRSEQSLEALRAWAAPTLSPVDIMHGGPSSRE